MPGHAGAQNLSFSGLTGGCSPLAVAIEKKHSRYSRRTIKDARNTHSYAMALGRDGEALLIRPVIRLEVILDRGRVGVADRGAVGLDHLCHLGVPGGGAHERRVHLDVVEAVAGAAVARDLVETGRLLELDRRFVGERGQTEDGGDDRNDQCAHARLPHATLSVTLCMTL